jgi:transposase
MPGPWWPPRSRRGWVARSLPLDELKGSTGLRPQTIPSRSEDTLSMTAAPALSPHVIGCDVGKSTVVVFDSLSGQIRQLDNTDDSLAAFAQGLPPDCIVVCEATGGYETALLLATADAGVPAHLSRCPQAQGLHPLARPPWQSIEARGRTRYGQKRHAQLARWTYPAAVPGDLQALVRQRVKQRAGLRCLLQPPHRQRKKPSSPSPP